MGSPLSIFAALMRERSFGKKVRNGSAPTMAQSLPSAEMLKLALLELHYVN
jgi:hypothetical protein